MMMIPSQGVSLRWLVEKGREWCKDAGESFTTGDVVGKFIVPETKARGECSYVELLEQDAPEVVKPHADVFVSHAWSYKFLELVNSVDETWEEDEDVFLWLDIFVANQHHKEDRPHEWWRTTFMENIGNIGRTFIVFAPWQNPQPLKRCWCLWEMYSSLEKKSEITICMSKAQREDFGQLLLGMHPTLGINMSFESMLNSIHCKHAKAYLQEDQDMILTTIRETVGYEALNKIVTKFMRRWFAQVTSKTVQDFKSNGPTQDEMENPNSVQRMMYLNKLQLLTGNAGQMMQSLYHVDEAIEFTRESLKLSEQLRDEDVERRRGLGMERNTGMDFSVATAKLKLASLAHDLDRWEETLEFVQDAEDDLVRRCEEAEDNPQEKLFQSFIQKPKLYRALMLKILALMKLGRFQNAKIVIEKAMVDIEKEPLLGSHPGLLVAKARLAGFHSKFGNGDEDIAIIEKCLETLKAIAASGHGSNVIFGFDNLEFELVSVMEQLVDLYMQKDLKKAGEVLDQVLEMQKHLQGEDHPIYQASLIQRANILVMDGQVEEGLKLGFETLKVIHSDELYVNAIVQISSGLLERPNQYQEAIVLVEGALERFPGNSSLQNQLGLIYFELGDLKTSKPLLESAMSLREGEEALPRDLMVSHVNLAACLNGLHETNAARALLLKARELPNYDDYFGHVNSHLATTHELEGDWEMSVKINREILNHEASRLGSEDHAGLAHHYNNLALALAHVGKHDEADEAMDHALRIAKENLEPECVAQIKMNGNRAKQQLLKASTSSAHQAAVRDLQQIQSLLRKKGLPETNLWILNSNEFIRRHRFKQSSLAKKVLIACFSKNKNIAANNNKVHK